ncbi:uncharacterized protein LOC114287650 [Camellia sinensis]|uniref:uncharacterized protein LOC114287650 n=1 Tax=Camellia sinensis TaxID=4442 RepID=UPI001036BAD5|nr:uncharacterized protein LOC114287650 [Camellia sinensis]
MANDGNGIGSSVSGVDPVEQIMERAVIDFLRALQTNINNGMPERREEPIQAHPLGYIPAPLQRAHTTLKFCRAHRGTLKRKRIADAERQRHLATLAKVDRHRYTSTPSKKTRDACQRRMTPDCTSAASNKISPSAKPNDRQTNKACAKFRKKNIGTLRIDGDGLYKGTSYW